MEQWKHRLKVAREAKELKKTAFAKLVGVSHPTVTDWEKSVETGGIKEITGIKLMKVCEVLGITPDWLYYGKEAAPARESLPDAMRLKCEDLAEYRLLAMYRLANSTERKAYEGIATSVESRLNTAARNKSKATGGL